MLEIGTPFQNRLQFWISFEAMDDRQNHHSGLNDAKALEKRNG